MTVVFLIFGSLSVLAFAVGAYDKWAAVKKKRRVSEKTLIRMALLGGGIGLLLSFLLCTHKTEKKAVFIPVLLIAGVDLLLLCLLAHFFT